MRTTSLGDLEKQIMDFVWECKSCSVRDVLTELKKEKKLAYTTVATIMGRLVEKGILVRNIKGQNYLYEPKVSRENFIAKSVHNIFTTAVSTLGQEAAAYFIKEIQRLSPRNRDKLLEMLDK